MSVNQNFGFSQIVGSATGGGGSTDSEWWSYPPPPLYVDVRNEEFRSDTLDPQWDWWTDPTIGTGLTLSSADNNVTLTPESLPAAIPRYKINNQRRPSWIEIQIPRSGITSNTVFAQGSWWLLKPLTPNADDGYITRFQVPNVWNTGGGPSSGVSHFLALMADTGGVPDKNNAIIIGSQGIGNSSGSSFANMYTVIAGVINVRPLGSFDQSVGFISGVGIRRRASSNWLGVYQAPDSSQTRIVQEFAQAFTPAYIGWWMRLDGGVSHNPINGIDLLRCPADKDALPI